MLERFARSHARRFKILLDESIGHLDRTLERAPILSPVYEVTTPRDETFYVLGYQFPDIYSTGKIYQQLLAIKTETQEIVGFSANAVDFTTKTNGLKAQGIIASNAEGHYYGYAMEVVRQHAFQEVANQHDQTVIHQVKPYFFGQTSTWKRFYGRDGVFGYDAKRRKAYQPTTHESASGGLPAREGYRLTITKEQTDPSEWTITRDDTVLDRSVSLNLHRRDILKDKLYRLAGLRK